jgi:hypothetical protein
VDNYFYLGVGWGYFGVNASRKTFQEKFCTYEIVNIQQIQGVIEMCEKILGTSSTYQKRKKKKCPYQQVSGNISFVSYS